MQAEAHAYGAAGSAGCEITADLLARYDRPGPRYTSYPTAIEFHEGVDARAYGQHLEAADVQAGAPVSLYVHLPFCSHRCTFCACNVIISPDASRAAPYLDVVLREAELLAARLPHRRSVSQLYLGGGTPTYFAPAELTGFLVDLFDLFTPLDDAELAVEADPRVTGEQHLRALAEIGFNRVSFGVQDFTPEVQRAIGRPQSRERTLALVDAARRCGFAGINVDLVYGLPHQTPSEFARSLDAVIAMDVDRLAIYSFAYVPAVHTHMKRIAVRDLPDRPTKLMLFALARDRLLGAGYEPIGMDHFAKPDDELSVAKRRGRLGRNFQGYCVAPATDVLGLGMSAIGDVAGAYVQNTKKLATYTRLVEQGRLPVERGLERSRDDELRRHAIHQLMCNFRIDVSAFEREHAIDFAAYFHEDLELLRGYERDGMVTVRPHRIDVTATGELFVRNLAMCFDRYLRTHHAAAAFSRTF
jgi:oxygen-independent coproporphyrinogen-3 oxidase